MIGQPITTADHSLPNGNYYIVPWGELKESNSLQAFQQAILTALPPPTTTVTQYTTHLTFAICMGSTVWRHTIQNACQYQVLPHPLFNSIAIFNIHNNNHFTTLITNNHTYYYYDSLNLRPPSAINKIYNTPPLLRQDTPNTHIPSTSQQTDKWTYGLHMILINLSTIYQGRIPTLRHTQLHAETLA